MQEDNFDFYKNLKNTELWRTILGCFLFLIIVLIFYGIIFYWWSNLDQMVSLKNEKVNIILFFTSFVTWHFSLFFIVLVLHKRSYLSLIGSKKMINWNHCFVAIFITILISIFGFVFIPFETIWFEKNTLPKIEISNFKHWLLWVLPTCVVIFIQISAEEMLFRGYLLQQLKARFQSFWVWAVFPSILFGVCHYDFYSFGNNTFLYMANAMIFGLLASILTVQSNNISYALGMHFINNIIGVLFFGLGDILSGLALVKFYFDKTGFYMTYVIISQTALQIITFLILFNWIKRHKN